MSIDRKNRIADLRGRLSATERAVLQKRIQQRFNSSMLSVDLKSRELDSAPLTSSQKRLWFINQLDPENTSYNENLTLRFIAPVSADKLQSAMQLLFRRHQALRAKIQIDGSGELWQISSQIDECKVEKILFENIDRDAALTFADKIAQDRSETVFNLNGGPLSSTTILDLGCWGVQLTFVNHHIISDAWSRRIFLRELFDILDALHGGQDFTLSNSYPQFFDFAVWESEWIKSQKFSDDLKEWKKALNGVPKLLNLPVDFSRKPDIKKLAKRHPIKLQPDSVRKLNLVASNNECTPYMVLLAVFQVVLYRWSGQEDVVVGSPIANRQRPAFRDVIGFFANTLPFRAQFTAGQTFSDFLQNVKIYALAAYDRQEVPLEKIVENLFPDRDTLYSPLIQVLFSYQNFPGNSLSLKNQNIDFQVIGNKSVRLDLSLTLYPDEENGIAGSIEYNANLFLPSTISNLANWYIRLLNNALTMLHVPLEALPMSDGDDLSIQRGYGDITSSNGNNNKYICLNESIKAKGIEQPDAIAIQSRFGTLTYSELVDRAKNISRHLHARGCKKGSLVGVCLERSPEAICVILGVLGVGAAYLPLDPEYPTARLTQMVSITEPDIIVVDSRMDKLFEDYNIVVLSEMQGIDVGYENSWDLPDLDDLAYIICTSGSTGDPKAVMVTHRNLVAFFTSMDDQIPLDKRSRVLGLTSISFDISVLEIFWTLSRGSQLVLARESAVDKKTAIDKLDFSLFFFGNVPGPEKRSSHDYSLLKDSVEYADQNGFKAVWTPERHFHQFGGMFPNAVVTSAMLSGITKNLQIRAGSVVLPLHNPVRVAEDWALVDQLSGGRVGISVATGWHPNDFVLAPQNYLDRVKLTEENLEIVRSLWSGDSLELVGVDGNLQKINISTLPKQDSIPVWLTASGNSETFRKAGSVGANLLTHLLSQNIDELVDKIAIYRKARIEAGHDPNSGTVTLMVHTYIDPDPFVAREQSRQAFIEYLKASADLTSQVLIENGLYNPASLSQNDIQSVLETACDKYIDMKSLIGGLDECRERVRQLYEAGVNEIACLIDFGVDKEKTLKSLSCVNSLRETFWHGSTTSSLEDVSETIKQHGVTHMQCTPTMARYMLSSDDGREALGLLDQLIIGGEVFPQPLLEDLEKVTSATITNMYGPTETTVWASVKNVSEDKTTESIVSIGHAIKDYFVYVLDARLMPVPKGTRGEIYIGGKGVARGYKGQVIETAERFLPDPFSSEAGARMYKTGDMAVVHDKDNLSFVGRCDEQVKVRGYRIELGDVEAAAVRCPGVEQAVACVIEFDSTDSRLVVFYRCCEGCDILPKKLSQFMASLLPEYMIPSVLKLLKSFPQLPNGKVDRKTVKTLFKIDISDTEENYHSASSDVEQRLLRLWKKSLQTNEINIRDNFFALGGHSLMAAQLVVQIRAEFQVDFPLQQFISTPNIRAQARYIENTRNIDDSNIKEQTIGLVCDEGGRYSPFPLTDVQQAYWVGRRTEYEMGNVACHFYGEQYFSLAFDSKRFNVALNSVIKRHDMLRAIVTEEGYQRVLPEVPHYECKVAELEKFDPDSIRVSLTEIRDAMSHKVYNTGRWPLFEICVTLLPKGLTLLHMSIDTIIADGASVNLIMRDLRALYQNPHEKLAQLQLSFRDYVLYLESQKETIGYQKALSYWHQKLMDLPPPPTLPLVKAPEQVRTPRFKRLEALIKKAEWSNIRAIGATHGLTPSSIIMNAYSEILQVWSNSTEFSLCLTLFDRRPVHEDVANLVGDFTSLMLLAINQDIRMSFVERAKSNQAALWEGLEHRQVSAIRAIRELRKLNGHSKRLSIPVVFTSELRNGLTDTEEPKKRPAPTSRVQELPDAPMTITQTPQVWLDHQVSDLDGDLHLTWDVVEELFPSGMLEAMFESYIHLLQRLSSDPELWDCRNVVMLPIDQLSSRHVAALLPPPRGRLLDSFLQQVKIQPNAQALISPERSLTYMELAELACGVGVSLHSNGAQRNCLIAIVMDRGWEQIVAVLGVLCSGAAYLPIMADVPQERLNFLLADGSVEQVLCQSWVVERYNWPESVTITVVESNITSHDWDVYYNNGIGSDLAYVIYTSGSTGNPKGVAIQHESVMNTIADINLRFKVGPKDRILSISSLAFDLSVWDIFGSLSAGACIILPLHERSKDPWHWFDLICEQKITIWNSVPALIDMCIKALDEEQKEWLSSLRLIMISGDLIPLSLPQHLKSLSNKPEVISLGGATEASIWSILYPIEKIDPHWNSIPYGKAMSNQSMHILNAGLEPCPDWIEGDLYISGVGLAREYWNDLKKTQQSFIDDPINGTRLYRTGDRARFVPGGLIEFIGREDNQIKIRGNRVELGEIESVLRKYPRVHDAVAVKAEDRDEIFVFVQATKGPAPISGSGLEINLTSLDMLVSEYDYLNLRSCRGFSDDLIPFVEFSALLSSLAIAQVNGKPKRLYPSAGGIYPINIFALLQDNKIEGLNGGLYLYSPYKHQLKIVDPTLRLTPELYSDDNKPIVETAGFSLFLIASPGAIFNKYGTDMGLAFCFLEAGYMGQQLLNQVKDRPIGLCPIGGLDFPKLKKFFCIGDDDFLVHSLIGGFSGLTSDQSSKIDLGVSNLSLENTNPLSESELRNMLEAKLPHYMIPRRIELIETFPVTANGKLDRANLASRILASNDKLRSIQHRSKSLISILESLLDRTDIMPGNNLLQIGIDSLQVIRLRIRIRNDLGVDLSLQEILAASTVSALDTLIKTRMSSPHDLHDGNLVNGDQNSCDWTQYANIVGMADLEQSMVDNELVSASISYIVAGPLVSIEERKSILVNIFQNRPKFFAVGNSPLGRIGQIMLPIFEDELYEDDMAPLLDMILDAVKMAGKYGAKVVSLTGMLPSATHYGADIIGMLSDSLPKISTGHATTVAAVKLNVDKALSLANRPFYNESLGILGLGSIGESVLSSLVDSANQPAKILLADSQVRMEHLSEIKRYLLRKGINCPIQLIDSTGEVPEEFYNSTLIVGATSVPELLDINRLRAGTIIIDDSFPKCVNVERAIKRMLDRQDLLIIDAGMLSAPYPLELEFVILDQSKRAESLEKMHFRNPNQITACVLSSALSAIDSKSTPTTGKIRTEDVLAHMEGLQRFKFMASAPQFENFRIPDAVLQSFRKRFSVN